MQIKRYEVTKIQEAMNQIKQDLGAEAVILSTKTLKDTHPQKIEVIAAVDVTENENFNAKSKGVKDIGNKDSDILRALERVATLAELREDLKSLKNNVDLLVDVIGLARFRQESEELVGLYQSLADNGMSKTKICHIIDEIRKIDRPGRENDLSTFRQMAKRIIASSLPKCDKNATNKRIKAFIGPTGIGKTTTLAKLAASYGVDKGKKVGLVTMDTFRIAAVEQLKIYAKIIAVPLLVAAGKPSFERSIKDLSSADVILVDTVGTSPNNTDYLSKIRETLARNDVEINLLLSPAMSREHLMETETAYRMTDYDNLVITKVDECRRYGVIYDLVQHAGKPIAYFTNGQNVPQDIEQATPERVAQLIMCNSIN